MRWLWLATVLSLLQLARGSTITIDDEDGDPTNGNKIDYQPPGAWISGSIGGCGQTCSLPNASAAYLGTYTGSIFNPNNHFKKTPLSATVKFTGTSVSVRCLISSTLANPIGSTDMTFTLDGAQASTYHHTPTGSPGFTPTIVFASNPLALGEHTLVIQNGDFNGSSSLVILDAVTYSTDSSGNNSTRPAETSTNGPGPSSSPTIMSPSSSSASQPVGTAKTTNNAAIVGAVVAVVAVLLLLALSFLYIRQRRKHQKQHRSNVPLSTTLFSPFQRLWSAARPPRTQPDMAPVPFPSPAPVSQPPAATPRPRRPGRPAPSSETQSRISRLSFNPNLLVGRFRRQPPPPIVTQPVARMETASPAPPSGNPLLLPVPEQNVALDRVASIQAWQQRTLEETAGQPVIHPLDMSEVDLSTHYDESSVSGPQPPAAPPPVPRSPQPPQRRFTVMNN